MSEKSFETETIKNGQPTIDSFIMEVEERHRSNLLKFLMCSLSPFLCYLAVQNIIFRDYLQLSIEIILFAAFGVCYYILKKKRSRSTTASRIILIVISMVFLYLFVDPEPDAYRLLWFFIYPLAAFFLLGKKEGGYWSAIFFALFLVGFALRLKFGTQYYTPGFNLRFVMIFAVVNLMAYFIEAARHETHVIMIDKALSLSKSEKSYQGAMKHLEESHQQLIQSGKLASIGELASGVAHELNQPLMVIRGTAQLIERTVRKGDLSPEALLTRLESIDRNTKRMTRIINHLRTFSRQSQMEFAPVPINQVIEESFLMIGEQLKLRDIAVKRDLAPDLPTILGDGNQLEQVFLNLIANSQDALTEARERAAAAGRKTPPAEITITTRLVVVPTSGAAFVMPEVFSRASSSVLDSRLRGNDKILEILISDTGGGIPADKVIRIFDPFFTTKAVGKGTGLGLSISYGIIKDHGGEIEVAETGPAGTTMWVRLPIIEEPAWTRENPPSMATPAGKGEQR